MKICESYENAVRLLPERLRGALLFLPEEEKRRTEEIRLRAGVPLCLTACGTERELKPIVSVSDLQDTLERAAQYSMHSVQESLRQGFLTAPGGLRLGVGGSMMLRNGEVQNFRAVSSLCVRLPGAVRCIPPELYRKLDRGSVLIYSPPGLGKTTFLRELIRLRSEHGSRVSVADERGEIAALRDGIPQFDVGMHTDILEFCPKTAAAEMLLRSMNPQVIAMDELTNRERRTVELLTASGVCVLATAHAGDRRELLARGLPLNCFDRLVRISVRDGERTFDAEEVTEC